MIFATIGILLSIFGLTTIRDYKLLEAKKEWGVLIWQIKKMLRVKK
jgi:predicted membrane chloride channel (bestrophin family)